MIARDLEVLSRMGDATAAIATIVARRKAGTHDPKLIDLLAAPGGELLQEPGLC